MKLIRLDLISFGKFNNYTIKFDDKFNLVYGLNESGKTTISKFIEGVFYGFVKPYLKRTVYSDDFEKYRPWNSENYEGSILVEEDGKNYVVYRNFKEKYFNIFNETTGKKETLLDGYNEDNLSFPGEYFFKMPLDIFKSTEFSNLSEFNYQSNNVNSIVDMLLNSTNNDDESISFKKALLNLEKLKSNIGTQQSKTKPLGSLYQKKTELEADIKSIYDDKKEYEKNLEKLNEAKLHHEQLLDNKEKLSQINKKKNLQRIEDAKNYKMQVLKDKANLLDELSNLKYINDIDEKSINDLDKQNRILNSNKNSFNELSKQKKLISKDYYQLKAKFNNYETIRDYISEIENINKKSDKLQNKKIKFLIISLFFCVLLGLGLFFESGLTSVIIAPITFVVFFALIFTYFNLKKLSSNRQVNKIIQKIGKITNISYKDYSEVVKDFGNNENIENSLKYLKSVEMKLNDIDDELDSILQKDEISKSRINDILNSSKKLKKIDVDNYRIKKLQYDQLAQRIADKDEQLKKISSEYDFSILADDLQGKDIKLNENDIKDSNVLEQEINESIEENAKLFEKTKSLERSVTSLLEKEEQLFDIKENISKLENEIKSIEIAMNLINNSINKLHKNFIPRINKRVSDLMTYSTSLKDRFRIDENLKVNIYDGIKFYDEKYLSSGTFDLLSIFIRISVLEELMGLDYMMILDDCLVQLDDERYKKCLDLLFKISYNNQIILFSCQNRDEQLLKELDIIYKKIELK